jgi:hypothetical protein
MRASRSPPSLVGAWFDLLPDHQRPTAQALHRTILDAVPQAELLVRSGNLYYGLGHQHALALAPHRAYIHLLVLAGGEPSPAFPHLVRAGKGLLWRFRLGEPVDSAGVGRLAMVCFELMQPIGPDAHH